MKHALNISERIALLNILPAQGNLVTLKIVRDLQSRLSFSEEEVKKYKIKSTPVPGGATVVWDSDFAKETKEIEIGDIAMDVIVEQLKMLEGTKRLRLEMLDLYERFVKNPAPDKELQKTKKQKALF